jgi:hypothetical protein
MMTKARGRVVDQHYEENMENNLLVKENTTTN